MQSLISYLGVMQEIIIPCLSHNSIWSWCKVSFRCRQHDAKSSLLCFTLATKHWRCLVSSGNKNNLVMCRKKCDVLIWCLSQKSRTKVHKITGDVCFQAGRKLLSPGWKSCICFPPCRPRPLSLSAFHFFFAVCSNCHLFKSLKTNGFTMQIHYKKLHLSMQQRANLCIRI